MIDYKQDGNRNNDKDNNNRTNGDGDSFNRTNVDDDNNPTYRQGSYQGARDSSSASRFLAYFTSLMICRTTTERSTTTIIERMHPNVDDDNNNNNNNRNNLSTRFLSRCTGLIIRQ